jgi:hypothetical protein
MLAAFGSPPLPHNRHTLGSFRSQSGWQTRHNPALSKLDQPFGTILGAYLAREPQWQIRKAGGQMMRLAVLVLYMAIACLFSQAAMARDEGHAVPIEKAPYHLPVFKNEYVTLLKIDVPPHRNTGFHTHTVDNVSVNIEEADMANQLPGQKQTSQRSKRGQPNFTAYSKQKPRTHKASNMGETPFHNVTFLLNYPQPGQGCTH